MHSRLAREVETILSAFEQEPVHVRHVNRLSGQLFTALVPWHGFEALEAGWLEVASLLHDIGWSQEESGKEHHLHSARLIVEHRWKTLLVNEIPLIALIARYHRKSLPDHSDLDFQALPPTKKRQVEILAGILRVADALDRTHRSVVESIQVGIEAKRFLVQLKSYEACGEELRTVQKKKDLLEQISGRKLVVEVVTP